MFHLKLWEQITNKKNKKNPDPLKNNIWSTIQLFNLPERVATCSFLRRESTEGSHFGKNIVLVFGEFSP